MLIRDIGQRHRTSICRHTYRASLMWHFACRGICTACIGNQREDNEGKVDTPGSKTIQCLEKENLTCKLF